MSLPKEAIERIQCYNSVSIVLLRIICCVFLACFCCLAQEFKINPSGFFEADGMWRGATTGDTISTKFGAIPLRATEDEWLGSMAHSRAMVKGTVDFGEFKLVGYGESDFLVKQGIAPFRWRQYWGQIEVGRWRLLGGQTWSLLRPNRKGILPDTELMNTHVPEPNYHVGLAGLRKKQLRLIRDFDNGYVAAVEYESQGRVLAKVAKDSKWGHAEVATTVGREGHRGASLGGVVKLGSRVNWVSQALWSRGAGPDMLGLIPDLVHAHSTVQGAEVRVTKHSEIFGYCGIVYGGRSLSNRVVREWTVGTVSKLYSDPRSGTLSFTTQYSQMDRAPWLGGHGSMNQMILSMRFFVQRWADQK